MTYDDCLDRLDTIIRQNAVTPRSAKDLKTILRIVYQLGRVQGLEDGKVLLSKVLDNVRLGLLDKPESVL